MNPSIGLQLWSVRNELQRDYVGTLEKVASIGYQNLELITQVTDKGLVFGKDMDAAELRRQLDRAGLWAVSCHIVLSEAMNWERILADCHTTGLTSLACAIAFFTNKQEVLDFCKLMNQYGALCKHEGVQLYYHNHFHEYQVFEGQQIMEIMVEQMDKDLVKFELDTYWAMRGGADPIAWLRKLGKRCDLLHQKDLPASAKPVNWLEVFGPDRKYGFEELIQSQDATQFAEIGDGVMDIPAIIEAGRTYGNVRYIFVEQDLTAIGELEAIKVSYTNLSRMLSSM